MLHYNLSLHTQTTLTELCNALLTETDSNSRQETCALTLLFHTISSTWF